MNFRLGNAKRSSVAVLQGAGWSAAGAAVWTGALWAVAHPVETILAVAWAGVVIISLALIAMLSGAGRP